mmetsp:Transcript_40123/g.115804  ORF Transcript_40123/g.115804 Transcript_40123/m.115804 type:complete len:200 (-) Transcript_40123:361-960(-)
MVLWAPTEHPQLAQAVRVLALLASAARRAMKHAGADLRALEVRYRAKFLAAMCKPAVLASPAAATAVESADSRLVEDGLLWSGLAVIPSCWRNCSRPALLRGRRAAPTTSPRQLATAPSRVAATADPALDGRSSTDLLTGSCKRLAADLCGAQTAEHTIDRASERLKRIATDLLSALTTEQACALAAETLGIPNTVTLS